MKERSFRSSIRTLFILSISVPLLIAAITFTIISSQQLTTENRNNISNTLSSIATSMNIYVSELNSVANVPYYDETVFNRMKFINESTDITETSISNELPIDRKYRIAFLNYIYSSSQQVDSVYFYPARKDMAYFLGRNMAKTDILSDVKYKDFIWYDSLIADRTKTAFLPEYDEMNELTSFYYVKSIYDVDTKEYIGFIKVVSSAKSYINLIKRIKIGPSSSLCIVSDDQTILYNHTKDRSLLQYKTVNEITENMKGPHYTVKRDIGDTGIQLIYLVSRRELLSKQLIYCLLILLALLLTFLLSYYIYYIRTKQIEKSVYTIKNSLLEVSKGAFKPLTVHPNITELNEIVLSTNTMIEKINDYIIKEYKANLLRQESDFKALQAQINPHFLYNTLNGFVALNRMGERKLLETSIINLTHLFRYTCNSSTDICLKDELDFINKYIELQKLKYDDRLDYAIEVDDSLLGVCIPKLLLQPLIENAILHGLEPVSRPIKIEVLGFTANTTFGRYQTLVVKDNGIGFSVNNLDFTKHVGLNNIRKRILYLNKDNLFHIDSKVDVGTCCIIMIKSE